MAMNIKDPETERLVAELAARTGETKTAAVREAVRAKLEKVDASKDLTKAGEDFTRFLREEIWPQVSEENRGKRITKEEREEILGYGPGGV